MLSAQLLQLLLMAFLYLLCLVSDCRCLLHTLFVALFHFHGMTVLQCCHRLFHFHCMTFFQCCNSILRTGQVALLLLALDLRSVHPLLQCPMLSAQLLQLLLMAFLYLLCLVSDCRCLLHTLFVALFHFHGMTVLQCCHRLSRTGQVALLLLVLSLRGIHRLLQFPVLRVQLLQFLLVAFVGLLCLVSDGRCLLYTLLIALFHFHYMTVLQRCHRLPCTGQVALLLPALGLRGVHRLLQCPVLPLQLLQLLLVCHLFLLAGCQGTLEPGQGGPRCLLFLLPLGLARDQRVVPDEQIVLQQGHRLLQFRHDALLLQHDVFSS